ncbi:hypothetical protein I5Q34_00510 [Streptomyces sp. AV19]|uniref:hypothetical protein n=1 Tax=Streptomyces sp. AV19 TaxID=2793068 RepID=UPI0018FE0996|nr:hypothetical protein [Streptomyces sp. AV19]MBH1932790.1 hypothetical protein [Streptomyces sp. AV19]MDG4531461.1 hypothetical protein [Streptomyces sp. AV19]
MGGIRAAAAVATVTGAVLLMGGGPASGATGPPADDAVHVVLSGAFENRPGELVAVDVQGVRPGAPVTVHSSAFGRRPVRLAPYEHDRRARGHRGRPAVAMTARPGAYPLAVRVGDRTVARDLVRVRPQKPPSFRLSDEDGVVRPGERFGLWFDDLRPGGTGSSFTARSPVLPGPVRLVHDPRGSHWNNPRMFTGTATLPQDAKDGTYRIVLAGPDGRARGERTVTVRAARPGDGDYLGRARGPAFFTAPGGPGRARADGPAAAGGTVNVLWHDAAPDPGEEGRLTATSPAFERPVPLRRDESRSGDGDDPRYYGPARIRRALGPGAYPVTVVSHHGRVRRTGRLVVTQGGASVAPGVTNAVSVTGSGASGGGGGVAPVVVGAVGVVVAGGVLVWRKRVRAGG